MKKQLFTLSVLMLSAGLLFTSCKKERTTNPTDNSTELTVQSDDQSRFINESDAADDDANAALENSNGSFLGENPVRPPLFIRCDATVTIDTTGSNRTITITYNGDTCVGGRRSRTGSVVISFAPGFRWSQAGASYTVTYNNLRITRLSDNKSITINGARTVTNVSGGRLRNLATSGPIVHRIISDGMTVTFDNGAQRSWKVARQRTFTYDNGMVISVSGISPLGNGIEVWGTNRFGAEFRNAILEPLVVKQSCNFRLVSGKTQHSTAAATTTTTFGLDADGNPVSGCPNGPFYFKVQWTGPNGNTITVIRPY